jgi:hypothetical protein
VAARNQAVQLIGSGSQGKTHYLRDLGRRRPLEPEQGAVERELSRHQILLERARQDRAEKVIDGVELEPDPALKRDGLIVAQRDGIRRERRPGACGHARFGSVALRLRPRLLAPYLGLAVSS